MSRLLLHALLTLLPWSLRRQALQRLFGWEIHPTARIGRSLVAPRRLVMREGAYIGHLNVVRGMDLVELDVEARIAHLNWIYAIPTGTAALPHDRDRRAELLLGRNANVVRRHMIDCSNTVRIGAFVVVAGYGTQILTHSIDIAHAQQRTLPVTIGDYAFLGTRCILLGGAALPGRSVLGAGSTLRNAYTQELRIYSGVPAKEVAPVPADARFFHRTATGVE